MRVHRLQDGVGHLLADSVGRPLFTYQGTTPTNGVAGYAVGCVWVNYSGTAGSILYVNQGTALSTTWLNFA